jgi:two-component system, sensor histidine kinase
MNSAVRNQAIARFRHLIRRGSTSVSRVLLPPASFEAADVERAFRAHHARRTAPQRRAGTFVALFMWVVFSAVDFMNAGPGSGAEFLYPKILSLRVLGTVAIAVGAFLASRPQFVEDGYSGRVMYILSVTCYVFLLQMVTAIGFPFSYLVDYPGLILYLMFVLGLLRLNAKLFLTIIVTVLPVSAYELYLSDLESIHSPPKELHIPLTLFLNYYYVTTMIYLTSSMIVGYMIAGQLERDARATFVRERELECINRTLMASRRDVEDKTVALIAAKEEGRAIAERANLDKSRFLADAVHDLGQPTQAVSLLVESARLALSRNDFATVGTLIEMTGRAVQVTRSSFNAVLEISRLESGRVKPTLTAFGVDDVVAEVVAPLRIIAADKGVMLRIHAARDRGVTVRSDRALLVRALANLATNAIKYKVVEGFEHFAEHRLAAIEAVCG